MPFVDAIEQALLDHFWNDPPFTPDANLYVGLSTTTPTDAGGNVTEPSGGSYARVQIPIGSMGGAGGTAPAAKSNSAIIAFAAATAQWSLGAQQTHAVIFNIASGGTSANVRAWAPLAVAKAVNSGDTPSFPIGQLVFQLGKGTPG